MPLVRPDSTLPQIAAIGLVLAGVGLVGMTAGDLPGIAEELAAPRWLMGLLAGVLVGSGLGAGRDGLGARRPPRWVALVVYAVIGIVLAHLSDLTRADLGHGAALPVGVALNSAGRVVFRIGIGIVLGWAAYEGSRGRARRDG